MSLGGGGGGGGGEGGGGELDPRTLFPLDSEALSEAERLLWQATQRRSFGDVTARKKLAALNPFEAGDGLLRCGGRLARAEHLCYDARCPIILPHDSDDVKDLLRHLHVSLLHAGVDQVLGESRRRYWIVRGRRTAGGVIRGCVECQKLFKQPQSQMMAPLPVERTTAGVPFANCGVDAFGPFKVKIAGRAFHKVWVAIFTCFAVRAVHFEVLRDMSASCFIDALVRFKARRPGV